MPTSPRGPARVGSDVDLIESERRIATLIGTRDFDSAEADITAVLGHTGTDFALRARLLQRLAVVHDARGDVARSRDILLEAVAAAERAGDDELGARIALDYALPSDWHQPTLLGISTLKHLSEQASTPEELALTRSARALVELRVPTWSGADTVMRWRSQPTLARRLADEAVSAAGSSSTLARASAALAWRSTHRSPEFVDLRRQRSDEVFTLAQDTGVTGLQVEAALWRAVDALEQGDRAGFDEALSLGRWVADESGNPRHQWRIAIAEHTAALLADDRTRAESLWEQIQRCAIGAPAVSPMMNELFFPALWLLDDGELDTLGDLNLSDDHPAPQHPIGMAMLAEALARTGDQQGARDWIANSLAHLDLEAGYLFQLARIARAVVACGDHDTARTLIELLTPWDTLVAVDSDAWGCEPPVAVILAELSLLIEDVYAARNWARSAYEIAERVGHRPALRRLDAVQAACDAQSGELDGVDSVDLSERELEVLALLAQGGTNPSIAAELNYSLSTIRRDTTIIYRKLGAANRPDAVSRAIALGLLDASGRRR